MSYRRALSARTSLMVSLTLGLSSLLAIASPVQAQETNPSSATGAARDGRQETLKQIVDRVGQATGLQVFVDTALSRQQIVAPDTAITRDTIEEYLTHLTRRLPEGTVWFKIYLPPSPDGRRYSPDAVAQLARAQIGLFGRPAPNTVLIQGKTLSLAEAGPVIQTLGLQPVYIVTSKQAATGPGAFPGGLAMGSGSPMMEALTKQLGVSKVSDIPTGTYKVQLPGPDGEMQEATVQVENSDGKTKISVRMGSIGADVKPDSVKAARPDALRS